FAGAWARAAPTGETSGPGADTASAVRRDGPGRDERPTRNTRRAAAKRLPVSSRRRGRGAPSRAQLRLARRRWMRTRLLVSRLLAIPTSAMTPWRTWSTAFAARPWTTYHTLRPI